MNRKIQFKTGTAVKSSLLTLSSVLAAILFLASCENEAEKIVAAMPQSANLTVDKTSLVLEPDQASASALNFTWGRADYGSEAIVANYRIQWDKKGGDFLAPFETPVTALSKSYTTEELNQLLINRMEISPNTPGEVDVRLAISTGNSETASALNSYSTPVTLTLTPYYVMRQYPSIYVPGAHQGWSPESAPALASIRSDEKYEGFVHFPDDNTEFKFTSQRNWDGLNYGAAGAGKLSTDGGNLVIAKAGYYQIKVDLNTNSYTTLATTWGVIGSATPNGWDSDVPMTYDAASQTWKVTLQLAAGEIKFRANDAWDFNYGDNEGDGVPDEGGSNIVVEEAGSYTVTLNLSAGAGNYTYLIKKN